MTDTPVRERVVAQIERKMAAFTEDAADDNNGVYFAFVTREELDHTKKFQGSSLSVSVLSDEYVYQTCYLQCILHVGFEFWYQMEAGNVASTQLGIVAAAIKKSILSDCNLIEDGTSAQLAENIRITRDSYDIQGPFEKVVSGFIEFDVIYRINKENPYLLM